MPEVVIDGECALCNRFAHFIIRHDRVGAFRFTANPDASAGTVVLIEDDGAAYTRSAAVVRVFRRCGGWLAFAARVAAVVPEPVRDCLYDLVARHRHGILKVPRS